MANDKDRVIALDIPLPEHQQLAPEFQKYFSVCEEKIGFVPNVLHAYSHDAPMLEAFSRFYNELMFAESGISPLEKEMIAVVVSSTNHCYYCQVAHGAAVRQYSENPELGEQMVMNYRAAELDERQMAMLDFAVKLTEQPDRILEEDRQRLRDAGFSEKDIWDIANVAAFYNMTNRVASAVEMQPNTQYHGQFR